MRALTLCALLAICATSLGQFTFSPPLAGAQTLDEVAQSILGRPAVQADLKMTEMQLDKIRLRTALAGVKEMFRAKILAKKQGTDTDDPAANTFNLQWLSGSDVKISDLTPAQRKRAHQLALQLVPHSALATSEMRYGLHLSSTQEAKLKKIVAERDKANLAVFGMVMIAVAQKHKDVHQQDEIKPLEEDGGASALAAIEAFERIFPEIMAKMSVANTPIFKKANEDALKVLTATQRRLLKRLQGRSLRL